MALTIPGHAFTPEIASYFKGWLISLQESYAPRGSIAIIRWDVQALMDEAITASGTLKLTTQKAKDIDKAAQDLLGDLDRGVLMLTSIRIESMTSAEWIISFDGYLIPWDDKLTAQDFCTLGACNTSIFR